MIVYGDDFAFDNYDRTKSFFRKNEEVFQSIAQRENIKIHWSTPKAYFEAISKENVKFATFTGDFFPYMCTKKSSDFKYWTGFYSLLPNFKHEIYEANELYRVSSLWDVMLNNHTNPATELNMCMHHDAITATCRPRVVEYYRKSLNKVYKTSLETLSRICASEMSVLPQETESEYRPMVVYNALNWAKTDLLKVDTESQFIEIRDQTQNSVPAQIYLPKDGSLYRVYFEVSLKPLSLSLFQLIEHREMCEKCAVLSEELEEKSEVSNGEVRVRLGEMGLPEGIERGGKEYVWRQKVVKFDGGRAGAYIFFPRDDATTLALRLISLQVLTGPVFSAAYIQWTRNGVEKEKITQLIVLPMRKKDTIIWEIESFALANEEIMLEIESPIARELIPMYTFDGVTWRQRKYREPRKNGEIGRNFYPISGAVMMGGKGKGWILIPYHPLGIGTYDGSYYLHLHRSLKQDDDFGLAHHIEDTSSSLHTFRLFLSPDSVFPDFPLIYHESKQANRVLSRLPDGQLSLQPVYKSLLQRDVYEKYELTLGFNTTDFYLSSISFIDNQKIIKVINMREKGGNIHWENWEIEEKLMGNRRTKFGKTGEMMKNADVVCAHDCENSTPVDMYGERGYQVEDNWHLKPKEFATFRLKAKGKSTEIEEKINEKRNDNKRESEEKVEKPVENRPEIEEKIEENRSEIEEKLPEKSAESPNAPPSVPQPTSESSPLSLQPLDFLPSPSDPPTELPDMTEAITQLEYSVVCSLGLISLGVVCLYLRSKKTRSD